MADAPARAREQDSPTVEPPGRFSLERIYSLRFFYFAIFLFVVLYIGSVRGVEYGLQQHFQSVVEDAVQVRELRQPVPQQIATQIDERVYGSTWVRIGGVQASVIVLARDAGTFLYVDGRVIPPPPSLDPADLLRDAGHLLPATADVFVSLPHNALVSNAILLFYAALLLWTLFVYHRAVTRRDQLLLDEALSARDEVSERAENIRQELSAVRKQMLEVSPAEAAQRDEIRELQQERERFEAKIAELAEREAELRGSAARAMELDQERQALEELLDEASGEIGTKDDEIRALEQRLRKAAKVEKPAIRGRESDQLGRRLRTLYKSLDIDDRAIDDLVALRDETMKLRAEELLKRLSDGTDQISVRRKVGGLPPQLSIFELGFAGKGRIYYTRAKQGRIRVLRVGAKNSQKTDLEYLTGLIRREAG